MPQRFTTIQPRIAQALFFALDRAPSREEVSSALDGHGQGELIDAATYSAWRDDPANASSHATHRLYCPDCAAAGHLVRLRGVRAHQKDHYLYTARFAKWPGAPEHREACHFKPEDNPYARAVAFERARLRDKKADTRIPKITLPMQAMCTATAQTNDAATIRSRPDRRAGHSLFTRNLGTIDAIENLARRVLYDPNAADSTHIRLPGSDRRVLFTERFFDNTAGLYRFLEASEASGDTTPVVIACLPMAPGSPDKHYKDRPFRTPGTSVTVTDTRQRQTKRRLSTIFQANSRDVHTALQRNFRESYDSMRLLVCAEASLENHSYMEKRRPHLAIRNVAQVKAVVPLTSVGSLGL
jgi:hypothetical protein